MNPPSEAWNKEVVLDDVELYHFATEGERKLAACLIRASIDDMVALKRYQEQGRPLARNVTIAELQVSRDWVTRNTGVLSFEECCNICAPDMDWRSVQQAILVDPVGALERVRNQKMALTDDVELPQTEAEIARGDAPITTGRLAHGLLEFIQTELEHETDDYTPRPMAF
ncbi:hypothetical protein [Variovorax gossypii]|uniref:hypothetical protein n=1 Tax=uncultured Variovorax sp. TaxID=114708 RepID=UPI0026231D14|nr:hypothetical protein [uncultured Variovorax sp.]